MLENAAYRTCGPMLILLLFLGLTGCGADAVRLTSETSLSPAASPTTGVTLGATASTLAPAPGSGWRRACVMLADGRTPEDVVSALRREGTPAAQAARDVNLALAAAGRPCDEEPTGVATSPAG